MAINQIGWANKQESQAYAQNLIADVKNGNQNAIDSICSGIFDSTAGRLGTNEAFVEEVINNADAETLTTIMDRYSEVTGSEIYKDIENDFSGKNEKQILEAFKKAYTSTKDEEYTGWNDGKLNNEQIAKSIGKGILDKLPSIGLIAAGTITAPAIASATGAILTGVLGAATAATVATIAAPVLAVAGIAAAGYMIYKGVTETKEAIDKGKNSQDDNTTMDAVRQGTNGVIETAEGAYIGYQSVKGLVESVKNIKTQIGKNNATEAPVEPKPSGETVENSDLNKTTNTELTSSMSKAETNKPIQFSDEEIAAINQDREMRQLYKAYLERYDTCTEEGRQYLENELLKNVRPTSIQIKERYQAYDSVCLNHSLRENDLTSQEQLLVDNLNKLFDSEGVHISDVAASDGILYRGVGGEHTAWEINGNMTSIKNLKVGDVFTEKGFTSTSVLYNTARSFAGENGYIMRIVPSDSTPLIDIGATNTTGFTTELEVLLRNNTTFQVVDICDRIITLSVIK